MGATMNCFLKHQRGQATIEFAIVAAAVIPLILVISLMAKISDVQHSTAQASQYAVWEKTSSPGKKANQLNDELRARFFTQASRPLAHKEKITDKEQSHRPYWVDHGGNLLLKKYSSVMNSSSEKGLASAKDIFDLEASVILDGMRLKQDGYWRSTVSTPLAKQSSSQLGPFKTLEFNPRGSAAILADGWTAYNKSSVTKALDDWKVTSNDLGLTLSVRTFVWIFSEIGLENDPAPFANRNVDHDVIPCEVRIPKNRKKNAC